MTIEIHEPELEALIEERMRSGEFASVEDVLLDALRPTKTPASPSGSSLVDVFEKIRGLGVDLDISRDRSPGRPVDL